MLFTFCVLLSRQYPGIYNQYYKNSKSAIQRHRFDYAHQGVFVSSETVCSIQAGGVWLEYYIWNVGPIC